MAALNMMTGVLFPLWALAHCFFGYLLFRVVLALNGLAAGFLLGAYMIGEIRQPPSQTDVLVAGIVGAILLMLAAWFLYRLVFAGGTGLLVAATILHSWPGGSVAAGVVAGVVSLLAALLVFVLLRDMVSVVTALAGALAFVVLVVDQWLWQGGDPQAWVFVDMPLTWGAIAGAVLLATLGLLFQWKTRKFGHAFGPPTSPAQRPRKTASVYPKFTRI